jgi:hypothetical protein
MSLVSGRRHFRAGTSFVSTIFAASTSFSSAKFLNDTSFRFATFSDEAFFLSATFSDDAIFTEATFVADADFSSTTFSGNADFNLVRFSEGGTTSFKKARFEREVYFKGTEFGTDISFDSAEFGPASYVIFLEAFVAGKADFRYSTAEGYLMFRNLRQSEKNALDFQDAAFEKASRISFHTLRLQPHWFVNIDSRKFVFTNCRWKQPDNTDIDLRAELKAIGETRDSNKLLTKTCWQLADNHEEMKSFPKASVFRQMANESKRLEDYKGWKVWSLHWWYWLSSFYGERPLRAGLVLIGILIVFAVAFMLPEFQVCPIVKSIPETPCEPRHLHFGEAILQSLATATFQSIEYIKPTTMVNTFLIILEKILAPVQAALFALAIRRKFMR